MLRSSLVALLLSAGCATSAPAPGPEAPAAPAPEVAAGPVRLGAGQTVQRGGHSLTFVGVAEDSRCPEDVECVWAGRATIHVEVDGEPVDLTLPYPGQTPDEVSAVTWAGVPFAFTALTPYPGTEADRRGEAVEATFTPQAP